MITKWKRDTRMNPSLSVRVRWTVAPSIVVVSSLRCVPTNVFPSTMQRLAPFFCLPMNVRIEIVGVWIGRRLGLRFRCRRECSTTLICQKMVGSTEQCCRSSGNADDVVELKEEGEEEESAPHSCRSVEGRKMKIKLSFSRHRSKKKKKEYVYYFY